MNNVGATKPLSAFIEAAIGGGTPPRNVPSYWCGPIPWASVKDLNNSLAPLSQTKEHISESGLNHSAANLVPAGTPIVCTRMAVGRTAIPTVDVAINQDLKALVPNTETDSKYFAHGLNYLQPAVEAIASGSTVRGISLNQLLKFKLYSPGLQEQRRIAEILDTLDDQIRATEQIIAKLKLAKKGFLKALTDANSMDSGGESWTQGPLGSFVEWLSGGTPTKDVRAYWSGNIPWLTPKDMKTLIVSNTTNSLTPQGARAGSKIAPPESVFIVVRGMILAHTFPVSVLKTKAAFNQDIKAVLAGPTVLQKYLKYWFLANSERLLRLVGESTHGTKKIDLPDLQKHPARFPPLDEQARAVEVLDAQERNLNAENAKLEKLRTLKQGLMADLMTGRVRVPMEAVS